MTTVSSAGSGADRGLEHGHVVGAEEVGHRDQGAGPAARQQVGGLGGLETRVDGDEDRPGGEQTQHGTTHSAQFTHQIATRSPGSTPSSTSAAAKVRAAAPSWA